MVNLEDMLTTNVTSKLKNTFVPIYAFKSTNYYNHLFITKLAKTIRHKVLTKTDENYISIDIGYAKSIRYV